ncbi:hypothetical protein [Acetobacterium wieringae]|uniref:hypothetical protein n=1 Tax=Acetobacterium wieringae TaxID=52694 RepID=UPI003158E9A1
MEYYIFSYKNVVIGGCELLIERFSKRLKELNKNVALLCNTIEPQMCERFKKSNIRVDILDAWNKEAVACYLSQFTDADVIAVTFFWKDYLLFQITNGNTKTLFYAVHYQSLCLAKKRSNFAGEITKKLAAKCIKSMTKRGCLLCMDEQTKEYTKNYYKFKSFNPSILRISVVPAEIEDSLLHDRATQKEFNILAIARADFPFKGYLLGLLDWISEHEFDDDLSFTIISYGAGENILREKIASLDKIKQRRIILIGKTDYDKLNSFYNKAKLYIGMGTTVIDAAQKGIIAIPVLPYTEKLVVGDFFYNDYRVLALDNLNDVQFKERIETVKRLSPDEYYSFEKLSRKLVVDNYSNNQIVDNLINHIKQIEVNKTHVFLRCLELIYRLKSLCIL